MSAGHGPARFFPQIVRAVRRSVRVYWVAAGFLFALRGLAYLMALGGWVPGFAWLYAVVRLFLGDPRGAAAGAIVGAAATAALALAVVLEPVQDRVEERQQELRERIPPDAHRRPAATPPAAPAPSPTGPGRSRSAHRRSPARRPSR